MLKKACPWCQQKVSPYQVGNRPRQSRPRWHQLSRVQVCPYCSEPIRRTGKGWFGLLAFLPPLLALSAQLKWGKEVFNASPWMPWLYACAFVGVLIVMTCTHWSKAED